MTVLFVTHPRFVDHDTGTGHPERPARLAAVHRGIGDAGLAEAMVPVEAVPAERVDVERVHLATYLDALDRFCASGGGYLDGDTHAGAFSWDAALLAAGAGLEAIRRLDAGEADAAFCAVRPPGHHALSGRAMGFCLVNNVAVAAAALADRGERVAIVDYDAHHGNGTERIFWDDPRVFYVSMHEWPMYPGTGRIDDVGGDQGAGTTLNLPFPAETTGDHYRRATDDVVLPALEAFAPTWLLISAGFDGHRADPITGLGLTSGDYADLTAQLLELVPAGRRLFFLEGGYDLGALADCTGAVLAVAADADAYRPEAPTAGGPGQGVAAAAAEVRRRLVPA